MLHARASSVPLIRSLALSGLDSRRGMFVDGDAVQGTLSRRRTMDNNGAFPVASSVEPNMSLVTLTVIALSAAADLPVVLPPSPGERCERELQTGIRHDPRARPSIVSRRPMQSKTYRFAFGQNTFGFILLFRYFGSVASSQFSSVPLTVWQPPVSSRRFPNSLFPLLIRSCTGTRNSSEAGCATFPPDP